MPTLAQKVKITFLAPGTRVLWVASKPGPPPTNAIKTDASEISYDFGGAKDLDSIYIWNRSTNNMATEMVESILQESAWEITESSETLIGEVKIQLQHDGKPLAAGSITAINGKQRTELMLTPSSNGEVSVFGIQPGPLKVIPKVPVKGQTKAYPAQSWEMTLARTQPMPILTIVIPDAVETATPATKTASKPGVPPVPGSAPSTEIDTPDQGSRREEPVVPPSGPMPAASTGGGWLSWVFALAALVGIGFLVKYLMANRSDEVAGAMRKLGVPVPDDVGAAQDDPAPVATAAAPIPKIILDAPEPTPIASITTAVTSLVGSAQTLSLAPGTYTVGRDPGCDFPFPDESSISRNHARIVSDGSSVSVEDLGSTNGTFVNGRQLQPGTSVQLGVGDDIQFGTVRFRSA